eukprot:1145377-Pelagomonas_calceolata.AAC.4
MAFKQKQRRVPAFMQDRQGRPLPGLSAYICYRSLYQAIRKIVAFSQVSQVGGCPGCVVRNQAKSLPKWGLQEIVPRLA